MAVETFAELLKRPRTRPLLMGVLNITPDSFFDGGRYFSAERATQQIDELLAAGADVLDLGAESTRPGSVAVDAAEQRRRLEPGLKHATARGACVSVDTFDPEVAAWALAEGAQLINDVSCLRNEALARVVAQQGAWLVLMHSRVPMSQMRGFSEWPDDDYTDIVLDVVEDWQGDEGVSEYLDCKLKIKRDKKLSKFLEENLDRGDTYADHLRILWQLLRGTA